MYIKSNVLLKRNVRLSHTHSNLILHKIVQLLLKLINYYLQHNFEINGQILK